MTRTPSERFGVAPELLGLNEKSLASRAAAAGATPGDIAAAMDWMIPRPCGLPLRRVGGSGDGGYLLPEDFAGIEAVFSPGVNNFKNFEDSLAAEYGIAAHMCDYTSDAERLRTPLIPGLQTFEKKWLDLPGKPDSVDLDGWVAAHRPGNGDLLLQMDIEGAEYRNLLSVSDATLDRMRMIVIELHGLELLADPLFLHGMFLQLSARMGSRFVCVHAHANNCCGAVEVAPGMTAPRVIELTLLRRDRHSAAGPGLPLSIPHPLDEDNTDRPQLFLTGPWLAHADRGASAAAQTAARIDRLERVVARQEEALRDKVGFAELNPLLYRGFVAGRREMAAGRPVTLSSRDPVNDPGATLAGGAPGGGGFSFHTARELRPSWSVDLGESLPISAICLFNRRQVQRDRARRIVVSVSDDGRAWRQVYAHGGRSAFGGAAGGPELIVPLLDIRARHVQVALEGTGILHLDRVEVWGPGASGAAQNGD